MHAGARAQFGSTTLESLITVGDRPDTEPGDDSGPPSLVDDHESTRVYNTHDV
jgi:hypothetical protein